MKRLNDALFLIAHGHDDLGRVREIAREALAVNCCAMGRVR